MPLREDHLLANAAPLLKYVEDMRRNFQSKARWGASAELADDLAAALGSGILDFLTAQVDERRKLISPPDTLRMSEGALKFRPPVLVAKTPRATNLQHFNALFPGNPLVVLVRDGRSVVESSMRSWGWSFGTALAGWAQGAEAIVRFRQTATDGSYVLVRYEDLVADTEKVLRVVLDHLDLDPARYDFEAALKRPVRGSSIHRGEGQGKGVHWQPLERTADFAPTTRWKGWSDRRHRRFNRRAGSLLEAFGYSPVVSSSATLLEPIADGALEALGWMKRRLGPTIRAWRRRGG